MDHPGGSFASPWAAVLNHHSMSGIDHSGFSSHPSHGHHAPHHGMAMNLHMPQSYSYFRSNNLKFNHIKL
uniref:CSON008531 protein n=1 Tax=Culicoides sonorensis TaxID=179676 RepID=A0A336LZ13_CULSO